MSDYGVSATSLLDKLIDGGRGHYTGQSAQELKS